MTVNMSGRPVSAPSGIGNDNQKREAETTPDLPSPRVREGMTEYDGSVYSYDVTRAGLFTFFNHYQTSTFSNNSAAQFVC